LGMGPSMASFLVPDWEWVHRPLHLRPLASQEGLIGMTVLYIVTISILSFCMKNRRAKEKELQRLSTDLALLKNEITTLEGDATFVSEELNSKKAKLTTLTKTHAEEKAKYKPINISFVTVPHNLVMCLYSLYTFVGVAIVIFQNLKKANFNLSILWCDPNIQMKEGMDFWVYTFYMSKYVEYLDTIFLLLKAKPVIPPENSQYFLHIYHHAITAAIVWVTMYYNFSTSWTGPFTNSFVHVLMYGYYFLTEIDKIDRSLGGKFITPIQIVQFMFCLASVIFESLQLHCGTHMGAVVFMVVNYMIFFVFFVKVYLDKTRERTQQRASRQKVEEAKKKE